MQEGSVGSGWRGFLFARRLASEIGAPDEIRAKENRAEAGGMRSKDLWTDVRILPDGSAKSTLGAVTRSTSE
jgi:hypothetical protein